MFSYFGTLNIGDTPAFYALHCNICGDETELLDIDNVKKIIGNRLILQNGITITCPRCGNTHKAPEPILNTFNDIAPAYTSTPKKGILHKAIEHCANLSNDDIQILSLISVLNNND